MNKDINNRERWWHKLALPNIKDVSEKKKIAGFDILKFIFYMGIVVIFIGITRYIDQVVIVNNLPNKQLNNSILQIVSPTTTMVLLAGALINTPLVTRYSIHQSQHGKEHLHEVARTEVLITGIIYSFIMTGMFSLLYIGLIEPFIFLQAPHISNQNYNIVYMYNIILFFCLLANSISGFFLSIFTSSGWGYSTVFSSVVALVVNIIVLVILSAPHLTNLGMLAIPICLLSFLVAQILMFLIIFLIKEAKNTTMISFKLKPWSKYFKSSLILIFVVIAMTGTCRYLFQFVCSTVVNSMLQNSPIVGNDVTNLNGQRVNTNTLPGISSLYWQGLFQYFYQIYLLFLLISFGIAQGGRIVFGINASKDDNHKHTIKILFTIIKIQVIYFIIISILLTVVGPYIAESLGLKNQSEITFKGEPYVFHNLITNTRLIFFICAPTLFLGSLSYIAAVIGQINYQPLLASVAISAKNITIIVFTLILVTAARKTHNFIYMFLAWPISDFITAIICILIVIVYIRIVKKSKQTMMKVNYSNIISHLRYDKRKAN